MSHPGVRWRHLMRARELTQRQVATSVQVSEKHLSQILTGKVMPSADLVIRLARLLGVDPRQMWLEQADFVFEKAQRRS